MNPLKPAGYTHEIHLSSAEDIALLGKTSPEKIHSLEKTARRSSQTDKYFPTPLEKKILKRILFWDGTWENMELLRSTETPRLLNRTFPLNTI